MTSSEPAPGVIKVGGSLLPWPGLRESLVRLLERRQTRPTVLLPGGGGAADWIRQLDRTHELGEERAHWLALRALDLNAQALAHLIPSSRVVESILALRAVWTEKRVAILAPYRFMQADESAADHLPHHWQVTSDSIAAHLAIRIHAGTLLLLKSRSIPFGTTRNRAAELALVDPMFPSVSRPLPHVSCLNLRDPGATEIPLPLGPAA